MRFGDSIRSRLIVGATAMLVAFVAAAGLAVQQAHADSVRAARFARLQGTVYLLLAGAELDAAGVLVMPQYCSFICKRYAESILKAALV